MRFSLSRAALGTASAVALLGGALLGSLPASAATITAADCAAQAGQSAVRAVSISQGDTIQLNQTGSDGHFEGQGTVQVFCRKRGTGENLGDISDARVQITVTPESSVSATFTIAPQGGVPSTGANPAVIGPFTGAFDFVITAPSSLLEPGVVTAAVATHIEVVTQAWGGGLIDTSGATLHPGTFGDVVAQTPELDSLPLFATGALGLLSYAGLRRRARGK
jgi:hypothetical protein